MAEKGGHIIVKLAAVASEVGLFGSLWAALFSLAGNAEPRGVIVLT